MSSLLFIQPTDPGMVPKDAFAVQPPNPWLNPTTSKAAVPPRSSSWCLVSTQAATDLWLLEWPQPLDLSVGGVMPVGTYYWKGGIETSHCYTHCNLFLLWILFFSLWVSIQNSKKKNPPTWTWLNILEGEIPGPIIYTYLIIGPHHSSRCDRWKCFTVSHNHGTPSLPPKQPLPHKIQ